MKRLVASVLLLLVLAACGDDDDGGSVTTTTESDAGIDADALQDTMTEFAEVHEAEFGPLAPPAYDTSEEILLGFVPASGDAVALCNALADWVASEGFDGVEIRVILSLDDQTPLASGVSGQVCAAA